jgi:hypothetical protein
MFTRPRSSQLRARASRFTKLLSAIALLPALALAATPQEAQAYAPSAEFIQAINDLANEMSIYNPNLWYSSFSTQLPGPDQAAGPDATRDGSGAFAFYRGVYGAPGAIYAWKPYNSYMVDAFPVYGAILSSWGAHGYEDGYGYPLSEERDGAGTYAISSGCRADDRVQLFASHRMSRMTFACWHRADGSVTWHARRT